MKKYVIWPLAVILALLCCAVAAAKWIEKSWLPDRMANVAIMGRQAHFASQPSISWFPPLLRFGKLVWEGEVSSFNVKFSAQGAQIAPDLFSFFGSQPELREVVLEKPAIHLQKIGPESGGADRPIAAELPGADHVPGIGRFVAQNGELTYKSDTLNIALDNLRLTGENVRPRQESTIQCDFSLFLGNALGKILAGNCALKTDLRYYAPNLTFRNGSITFTAVGPQLAQAFFSPCRAQFEGAVNVQTLNHRLASCAVDLPAGRIELEGETKNNAFAGKLRAEIELSEFSRLQSNFVVESPFAVTSDRIELSGADLACGDFQAAADASLFFASQGRLADVNGQWAGGEFAIKLANKGQNSELSLSASKISLGEVLNQAGAHGFAGGPANFTGRITFPGESAQAALRHAKGSGTLECGRLELEPFGELSMLLPLLGHPGALMPKVIDNLKIAFNIGNGQLSLNPIRGDGPEFDLRGFAGLDMLRNTVSGDIVIRALGLELPLAFDGALSSPNIRIDPNLLKR